MRTSPILLMMPLAAQMDIAEPHHLARPRESFWTRLRRLRALLWAMVEDPRLADTLIFNVGQAGMAVVASNNNAAGASTTIDTGVFDPENWLWTKIRIAGYSASQIAQVQLGNPTLDTGTTNYSNSNMEGNGAPVTQVAATAAGWKVAASAITAARAFTSMWVRNISGQVKSGIWTGNSGSEAAATAPTIVQGAGIWATTSGQISRMRLDSGGAGNLLAGSDIVVHAIRGF
jgi:hypothetical protein